MLPRWLVENQRVARALPIIGKGAYATLAAGFLCTDILTLRLLLVSGYTGLTAFHALHRNPLRIPLRWSILLAGVNVTMVAKLVAEQLPVELSAEERALHAASFAPLSRRQCKQLLELAERVTFDDGDTLTEEGVVCPYLMLILEGAADMRVDGRRRRLAPLRRQPVHLVIAGSCLQARVAAGPRGLAQLPRLPAGGLARRAPRAHGEPPRPLLARRVRDRHLRGRGILPAPATPLQR